MNREPELKFRVAKGKLTSLAKMRMPGARASTRANRELVSTYYDTRKQKLQRHNLTLRVRRIGERYLQTVKRATPGNFARGEWEANLDHEKPDLDKAADSPLASVAGKKLHRKLKPIFRTSIHRTTRAVHIGSSDIELAVDRGDLTAGRRSQPIAELELELKKGSTADLFRLARRLERRIAAELDLRSKAERGYELVNSGRRKAVHAEMIDLNGSMTANDAFNVIAFSTLRQFVNNGNGVRSGDAEAIHQMRVGLRRLRAAISLFGDILPGAATAKIKAELKWLTGELAPAREIDVLVEEKIKPLKNGPAPKRGARAIEKDFSTRRKDAFRAARDVLRTARYRVLLLDVIEWLETRRKSPKREADMPVGTFAHNVLDRRTRQAVKQGRDVNGLAARDRHKLRIKIKKIRYAVDFFRSLYPNDSQTELQEFSSKLKKIQDVLGALNDFMSHEKLASRAALEAPRTHRRARAFTSGVLVGQEHEASHALIKAAQKQMRRLRPLKAAPA
jgi:triphosphatase